MAERIRLVSFNIAHGRGLFPYQGMLPASRIRKNLTSIAGFLREVAPDIVAMQEIDTDSHWNGHIDQPAFLADAGGFAHVRFGPTTYREGRRRLHYGNAILSRFDPPEHDNRPFSRATLGGKGYQFALFHSGGHRFAVVNLHLCYRSLETRRAQIATLLDDLRGRTLDGAPCTPLICGDFNASSTRPLDAVHALARGLAELGYDYRLYPENTPTFPSLHPLRRLDFFFIPASWQVHQIQVPRLLLSDHLPVVAEFTPGAA
jgi:endonuclease/exonuclease/phosphatase family metal-dependent hydrolase